MQIDLTENEIELLTDGLQTVLDQSCGHRLDEERDQRISVLACRLESLKPTPVDVPGKMNRLEALCISLGWQGGTIYQVAAATGCAVDDLLGGQPSNTVIDSDYHRGWFAGRDNTVAYNREFVFPFFVGNLDFWLGLALGIAAEPKPAVFERTSRFRQPPETNIDI